MGVPLVDLYFQEKTEEGKFVLVNRELVIQGVAEWFDTPEAVVAQVAA